MANHFFRRFINDPDRKISFGRTIFVYAYTCYNGNVITECMSEFNYFNLPVYKIKVYNEKEKICPKLLIIVF
jgi:hypothetical protein